MSTATATTKRTGPADHYVPADVYEAKKSSGHPLWAMTLRAACGTKATSRATLYYVTDPVRVTCKRCLAKMPADEAQPYECPECGTGHDGMTTGTEWCPGCSE